MFLWLIFIHFYNVFYFFAYLFVCYVLFFSYMFLSFIYCCIVFLCFVFFMSFAGFLELRILRPGFSLQFLIKHNKELASDRSGSSLLLFPYSFLSKTIRKMLPIAQDPSSFFLTFAYYKQNLKGKTLEKPHPGTTVYPYVYIYIYMGGGGTKHF